MKRLYLFSLLLSLATHNVLAQYYTNQNKVWAFGNHGGLKFTSGIPVPFSSNINILEGCGSVSDTSGNLLFYTDGKKVWDRTGTVMPHGSSIVTFSTGDAAQGATIVPVPSNPNQYYIFSSDVYTLGDVAWSIVDMTLHGGNGDVLSGSGVSMGNHFAEKMTTVAGNNCNVWLLLHRRDTAAFWAYNIDAGGIHAPVVSTVGTFAEYNAGVTKVSSNRLKVVCQVGEASIPEGTELYDFNPTTGVASNCQVLDMTSDGYGAEFSPDNSKLYTSTLYGTTIYQYDISLSTTAAIIASKTNIGTTHSAGDFKLGPDGKIYIVEDGYAYVDRIQYPNVGGSGCGFVLNAVGLSSGTNGELGLPNEYFAASPSDTFYIANDTLACLSISGTITIAAHDSLTGSGYLWNNGTTTTDTLGGITSPGTYWVNIYNGCSVTVDTIHVTLKASPGAITGTMKVCAGSTTALTDTGGTWSSGSTGIAIIGSLTGIVTGVSGGTDVITYTSTTTGCMAGATVTVSPLPAMITGSTLLCSGPSTLTDSVGPGIWSSSNPLVATIDSLSGIVSGVTIGTSTITYKLPTGCARSIVVSVNVLPSVITGFTAICIGASTGLSDSVAGGSWSSGSPGVASIGSSSGIVTGVTAGTAIITYTLPSGCTATITITVNAPPGPITGLAALCIGSTTVLSDAGGGIWSSGSPGIATVGSLTGIVTGISVGGATITYSIGVGCNTTVHVTVSPLPSVISGPSNLCLGVASTLSDTTSGGYWTSTYPGIASIGSTTGIIMGLSVGATPVTYTLGSGTMCSTIITVTVNPFPGPITGLTSDCNGQTTTLYDAGTGSWSSGSPLVATIGSATGVVTGVSPGTAVITYTLPAGCFATFSLTIEPLPSAITGTGNVCVGLNDTLADTTVGGYWSSSDPSTAYIDAGTGIITGTAYGTATMTYTLSSSGCFTTRVVTVNPAPTPITGVAGVCLGGSTTLYDGVAGGTWSSGSPGVAPINPVTGIYNGAGLGTALMSYSMGAGCNVTFLVHVYPIPVPITGTGGICPGMTLTLSDATVGGTWSSALPGVATIGSGTGIVTGVSAGTTTISYSFGLGVTCAASTTVTVNPAPSTISGITHACPGTTTTLSDGGGGTWLSGSTSIATIGSTSGLLTGVLTGTTTVTYTLPTGCSTTIPVSINPLPAAIGGGSTVCIGAAIALTDGTTGGTWSKSNTNVNIGSTTGVVSGVTAGTAVITYTLPTGCYVTKTVTVNSTAGPITGTLHVCPGSTTALSDATLGGAWTSSAPAIAPIGSSTGIVTGVALGTTNITYLTSSGCMATAVVTVNPLPSAITGPTVVCAGSSITVTDPTGGGTWATSGTVATVGSGTGVVTGLTSGTSVITYTLSTGCASSRIVTVNALPTITGPTALCVGSTIAEVSTPGGGTWTSGTPSVATIGSSSGVVTGVTTGTTIITYTSTSSCKTTVTVNVTSSPTPITGVLKVCTGATTALSDGIPGGAWSSSLPAVATVGSLSGIVTGAAMGVTTITYSLGSGCIVTKPVTVVLSPYGITGPTSMCTGTTSTLIDLTTGGTWTSSSPTVASIGSLTGSVNGISAGITMVTYTITSTGCTAITTVTVNTTPPAITGPTTVCVGASVTESDAGVGGVWSATGTVVSIGSATGLTTGVAGGTGVITYSIGSCSATRTMSVNNVAVITGVSALCAGATATLTDATGGGTWSSSAPATATVGSTSGLLTGVAAGTVTITYAVSSGCFATKTITVNPVPFAITGTPSMCMGMTTTLSDGSTGGSWTSSNLGVATVVPTTGVVNGIAAGTATISYAFTTGCATTKLVTVYPLPLPIGGVTAVCIGATGVLSDGLSGGTWVSASTGLATVGSSTGLITGVSAGVVTISYTLPTGCMITRTVTVNSLPSAITGGTSACVGQTTALGDGTAGGVWSSSNTAIASVGSGTGVVTGVSGGTVTISYTLPTGCFATMLITVNTPPLPITGIASICAGAATTLSDAVIGGAWSSGATAVATVGSFSGVVTGVASGTAVISYTEGTGCTVTKTVTVNPLPSAITGTANACVSATTMLSDTMTGGTWSSSNTAIATVGSGTGIVTGVLAGTAIMTYTTGAGCIAILWMTVNPLPPAIIGGSSICSGLTVTLSDPATGGLWSSGSTAIATVGSTTGIVTGVSGGSVMISYTLPTGCSATHTVSVTGVPPITGITNLCAWGDTVTVHNATITGSYSSTLVTVTNLGGGAGLLTAMGPGVANVYYTLPSGCSVTATMTINPIPGLITGRNHICVGTTTTLTNTITGGMWSSSNPAIAAAGSATGLVTGIATGIAYVTYTLPTGCSADTAVHVNPDPAMIVGYPTITVGTSTMYTDATSGGTWISSSPAIATIGTAGVAHGVSAGVVTFSYELTTGCMATKVVSVNPLGGARSDDENNANANGSEIRVIPNPNKGTFTITGTLGTPAKQEDEDVWLELTDVLGRVVYNNKVLSHDGRIEYDVSLGNISNGMYLLSIRSGYGNVVMHVVVSR